MMGKMSRDKGKTGELEVAHLIESYGFEARRGQQHRGGPGTPDVIHSIPNRHIEVKRTETLSLYKALDQAAEDAAGGLGGVPVVFHRRSRRPWVVILDAHEFLAIMEAVGRLDTRLGMERRDAAELRKGKFYD